MTAIDWTKPIETKDGRKARVLCTDLKCDGGGTNTVAVIVATKENGSEYVCTCNNQGNGDVSDFINVPDRRVGWLNIYEAGTWNRIQDTREAADELAKTPSTRIACVKVEYEIGEGLETSNERDGQNDGS